jgi:uncharacterized protein with von Willebrand factor type A (vWA) domain
VVLVIDSLLLLANILRERGILVSTPEIIDSLKGLVLVRSQDVSVVKAVIKAAMVKDRDLSRVFDEASPLHVFTGSIQRIDHIGVLVTVTWIFTCVIATVFLNAET